MYSMASLIRFTVRRGASTERDKVMGCHDPARLERISGEQRIREVGRKELNEDFKIEMICELISARSREK